jgi:hypothetical protein
MWRLAQAGEASHSRSEVSVQLEALKRAVEQAQRDWRMSRAQDRAQQRSTQGQAGLAQPFCVRQDNRDGCDKARLVAGGHK